MTPLDLLVIYGSVRHRPPGDQGGAVHPRRVPRPRPPARRWSTRSRTGSRCSTGCTRNTRRARPPRSSSGWPARIKAADAFIIVSGEYNHSIPPALSNLLDHFLEEYFWRPSAIVCYSAGAFGGVRAAMQLRAMLCELGTPSIPSLLPVPRVQDAFDDDGRPRDEAYHRRAARFLDELEWYANALKAARQAGVPY